MHFFSDNGAGADPRILHAVAEAMAAGPAPAYGGDAWTQAAEGALAEVFEHEVAVFLLTSGTAANALALSHLVPPWGAVLAHEGAHVNATECGAFEFYSTAKILPVPGLGCTVTPAALRTRLAGLRVGDAHQVQAAAVSITNLTESGTRYGADAIGAVAEVCRAHGLKLHMDGARFANAVAGGRDTPADLTWRAGVDALSLGATKNGALAAEAVLFFDPALAEGFGYRRMRGGHLLSKMRFVAAQFTAWLKDGHWLTLAARANGLAARLGAAFVMAGDRLAWPVEGNEVFPILSTARAAALRAAGVGFHPWSGEGSAEPMAPGEGVYRFVTSFATPEEDVARLSALLAGGDAAASNA